MAFQIANQRLFLVFSTKQSPSLQIEIGSQRTSTRPFFRSKSRWDFVDGLNVSRETIIFLIGLLQIEILFLHICIC